MLNIKKIPLQKYAVKKHFVTFYFGRSFCSDECQEPIDNWIVDDAIEMAKQMKGLKPYGFTFYTKGRKEADLDSFRIATSRTYYFGGTVVVDGEDNHYSEYTLLDNMRRCKVKRAIITVHGNGVFLGDDDIVLKPLNEIMGSE